MPWRAPILVIIGTLIYEHTTSIGDRVLMRHTKNKNVKQQHDVELKKGSTKRSSSSHSSVRSLRSLLSVVACTIIAVLGFIGHSTMTPLFLPSHSFDSGSSSSTTAGRPTKMVRGYLSSQIPVSSSSSSRDSSPSLPHRPAPTSPPKLRLHRDHVHIVREIARGMVNSVFECQIISKEWWDYQYSLPSSQQRFFDGRTTASTQARKMSKFLLKVGTDQYYCPDEFEAMKRIYKEEERAIDIGFLPLVESWANVTNPFLNGDMSLHDIDASDETDHLTDHNNGRVYAVIVPDASVDKVGFVYDPEVLDTIPKIRLFMNSILKQLQHAWKVGVNNMDLSGDLNVYVSKHNYQAILFDWNGWIRTGKNLFDPYSNLRLVPPENWIEILDGKQVIMSDEILHSYDVWSVGYMLARLLYQPHCAWADQFSYRNPVHRLRETILKLGSQQHDPSTGKVPHYWVPVGDGTSDKIDLTKVANITEEEFEQAYEKTQGQGFVPLLQGRRSRHFYSPCPFGTQFDVLIDPQVPKREIDHATDLLKQMMTIGPMERPNYDQLLAHPFFTDHEFAAANQ